jgi:serine/threonine protein kinase
MSPEYCMQMITSEISVLKKLSKAGNCNIVKIIDVIENEKDNITYIILEYCDNTLTKKL